MKSTEVLARQGKKPEWAIALGFGQRMGPQETVLSLCDPMNGSKGGSEVLESKGPTWGRDACRVRFAAHSYA